MRYKPNQSLSLKWLLVFAVILALAAGLAQKSISVRADVAPPKAPPGANPEVAQITQVRMMDEKVVIEVLEEDDITQMGTAFVWAEFHMKNLGDTTEVLMVRFPSSYNDGFSGYPEIKNLMVSVDNATVPTSRVNLEGEPDNWDDPVQWVEFEVVFPPGEIVEIEVDYTLYGTGEYPFVSYSYLLETGAGWNGTIGSAEIIVRFPYKLNAGIFSDGSPGWGGTTPGVYLNTEENELFWYFEDFEPTSENNISFVTVWPSVWQRIIDEQKHVSDFPNDGEAWGRLAKLYKETSRLRRGTRTDAGGIHLYKASIEAYKKALDLLPDDALWHAGYADLLLNNSFYTYRLSAAGRDEILQALNEIYTAYKLDPDHSIIQEIANQFPREAITEENGELVFYWLTQTPALADVEPQETTAPQADPTSVTFITATPQPEPTQPPTAVSVVDPSGEENISEKKSLPICGSTILFPLGLIVAVSLPQIRSKKSR